MKRIYLFIPLFLFIVLETSAQTKPAYQRADVWYRSNELDTSGTNWLDISKNDVPAECGVPYTLSEKNINFHRAIYFPDSTAVMRTAYPFKHISHLTVITVFNVADTTQEHAVWSLDVKGKQLTALSDRRLIREKTFYEYPLKHKGIPILNVSVQSFSKKRGDSVTFLMGQCVLPDSTTSFFKGDIAECMVFDKFLKKREILRIETYLALKYGISLYESNYVTPYDSILWDYDSNKIYSHAIAGIGRDSVFGLDQRQSCSEEEDVLTIGVGSLSLYNKDNTDSLGEGSYLIWGHDEGDMSCENPYDSIPLWERRWLMEVRGAATATTIVKVKIPVRANVCYLVIDRSGMGNFDSTSTEYFAQAYTDSNGYVYFTDIGWDTDRSGKDVFTFSPGNTMMESMMVVLPDTACKNLGLSQTRQIKKGESVTLEAKTLCFEPVSYQWRTEDGFYSESEKVEVKEEGEYTLRVTSADGTIQQGHTKISYETPDYATYKVYPNPSKGDYTVEVMLPEESEITLRIYTVNGSLLKERMDSNKKHYIFEEHLETQGYYFVNIISSFGEESVKLVITR